jgi:hypothetical protein
MIQFLQLLYYVLFIGDDVGMVHLMIFLLFNNFNAVFLFTLEDNQFFPSSSSFSGAQASANLIHARARGNHKNTHTMIKSLFLLWFHNFVCSTFFAFVKVKGRTGKHLNVWAGCSARGSMGCNILSGDFRTNVENMAYLFVFIF